MVFIHEWRHFVVGRIHSSHVDHPGIFWSSDVWNLWLVLANVVNIVTGGLQKIERSSSWASRLQSVVVFVLVVFLALQSTMMHWDVHVARTTANWHQTLPLLQVLPHQILYVSQHSPSNVHCMMPHTERQVTIHCSLGLLLLVAIRLPC